MFSGDAERVVGFSERLLASRGRLAEVITRRVINGRARAPGLALDLLVGFGGPRAGTYLRRIAETRNLPDIVRFGAQRRVGWPEQGEARHRLRFLETLAHPDQTLVVAVDQGTESWPPQSEILAEVVGYLAAMPGERQQDVLSRAMTSLGARSTWLARAALQLREPATQRLALRELTRLGDREALGAIERLAAVTRDPELRAEAEEAARRLAAQPRRETEPLPLPELDRACATLIDGAGGQVVLVIRRWAEGAYLLVNIFEDDSRGVVNVFGWSQATDVEIEEMTESLAGEGIELVEVDLAAVRGIVQAALKMNAANEDGIPPAFELWEPFLHDGYPPADDEPAPEPVLDWEPYVGRRDLTQRGGELIEHPWFETWQFHAEAMERAMALAPPPSGPRLTEQQYRPLIEELASAWSRAFLVGRLRRQAWLLDRSGDAAARDIALALVGELAYASPAVLAKQPFLRVMVDRGVTAVLED